LLAIDIIKDDAIKKEFIGKKVGDTLIFDPIKAYENKTEVAHMLKITPEDAEVLASEFKFTINEVNVFKSAEVNEELYKKVYGEETEIKTEEEFRLKVKEEIANSLVQSSDYKFALDTRNAMVEKIKMELPEAFLKRWLQLRNDDLTDEQIENDFDSFMEDLKWQIIRDLIVKDNELKISDEEAMDFARQITFSQFNQYGMYNMPEDQLDSFAKMMLEKEEEKERIYRKLMEDKVMAVVKEKTNIQEKEVSNDEFTAMMK
jgi:trigger factor